MLILVVVSLPMEDVRRWWWPLACEDSRSRFLLPVLLASSLTLMVLTVGDESVTAVVVVSGGVLFSVTIVCSRAF
jgi:hypothetical protein